MSFEPDVSRDTKRLARQSGSLAGATLRLLGAHVVRAPFGREASDAAWARFDRSIRSAGEAVTDLVCSAAQEAADSMIARGQQSPEEVSPKPYPRWMFWRH